MDYGIENTEIETIDKEEKENIVTEIKEEEPQEILDKKPLVKKKEKLDVKYSDLFWLFMLGSLLGFVLEGFWRVFRVGHWENHSAVVWGPFCIIYGLGGAAIYVLSALLKKRNIILQFIAFCVAGGAVEYFCALFQELAFGSKSWDYTGGLLNIGGKVDLPMTLIWGVLGIVFVRLFYPLLMKLFKKMRGKVWNIICIILSVFMAVNMLVSALAVYRWSRRIKGEESKNRFDEFFDEHFDNEHMRKIYNNMIFPKPKK